MHALLPLVSCPAGFLWPHPPSTTQLDLIPHCLAFSSSSMCVSVLALRIWLAGWVLVLQDKNPVSRIRSIQQENAAHTCFAVFFWDIVWSQL